LIGGEDCRVENPIAAETGAETRTLPPGSWLVVADHTDNTAMAEDFAATLRSTNQRVNTANLDDESAVFEAFGEAAADP
jgi:hypothetical protein